MQRLYGTAQVFDAADQVNFIAVLIGCWYWDRRDVACNVSCFDGQPTDVADQTQYIARSDRVEYGEHRRRCVEHFYGTAQVSDAADQVNFIADLLSR